MFPHFYIITYLNQKLLDVFQYQKNISLLLLSYIYFYFNYILIQENSVLDYSLEI